MEARVVGGRAALLVWSALVACDSALARSPMSDPAREPSVPAVPAIANTPAPEAPAEALEIAPPQATAPSDVDTSPDAARVVLVTVDGVRWEDVFAGVAANSLAEPTGGEMMMPHLHRLVRDRGIALGGPGCEHDVRASGPSFVSLPGYLEIFTGKPTTCTHNGCPGVDVPTVIDEARAIASSESDVAVFASWGRYALAVARDRKAIVVSAGASTNSLGPKDDAKLRAYAEAGARSAGYPGHGDYRPDVHTAQIALRYLETKRPHLLVVGLGDADEYAHRGDHAGYRRALRRTDEFIADLDRTLERMGEDGRETAVLVTTDHGRAHSFRGHGASFPESQRVFVAAFGAGVARRGATCTSSPLRLAHVAGAVRTLLGLEGEAGPLAAELVGPN